MKRYLKVGIIVLSAILVVAATVLVVYCVKSKPVAQATPPAAPVKVIERARADLSKCKAENVQVLDGKIVLTDCVVLYPENVQ